MMRKRYSGNLTFLIMNKKLEWLLGTWFGDSFHCSMIEKAINSESVSLAEFINGFDSLRNAQWDNKDDFETFIPDEFKMLYDSTQKV